MHVERGLRKPSRNPVAPRRQAKGFTLIELMVVVAIVAILAAIAYPSYTSYIVRKNRAAAAGLMLEISNLQQRFMLDSRSYAPDLATLGVQVPPDIAANYDIVTKPNTATTQPGFTTTATPKNSQAARDTTCAVLTIYETGLRQASGGGSSCW
ncbi:MAG: prepilin-type N-terminal cleavage/methylation domain-containing protein [Variovorax sp.]|nr:prepilin-type N-terminal cleavage/methylation domain-containing protein [Variovorax sp.]